MYVRVCMTLIWENRRKREQMDVKSRTSLEQRTSNVVALGRRFMFEMLPSSVNFQPLRAMRLLQTTELWMEISHLTPRLKFTNHEQSFLGSAFKATLADTLERYLSSA